MLTNDQFAAIGRVLTAHSWLQGNVVGSLGVLVEGDVETTVIILNSLTIPDRVRVAVQPLEKHANRKKVSTSAFQRLDAALRTSFGLLAVPLSMPGLTFDANMYAENRDDDWSGFNLAFPDTEIEQMASAYLNAAAGFRGQSFAAESERRDGKQIFDVVQLAGSMPLESQQRIVAQHAAAVGGDTDEPPSAIFDFHPDRG